MDHGDWHWMPIAKVKGPCVMPAPTVILLIPTFILFPASLLIFFSGMGLLNGLN